MTSKSIKHVAFGQEQRLKCSPSCPRLIYDDPHIFRVRSERPSSRLYPCETCLRTARQQQQQVSTANIQYQKRCSRLPPIPIEFEQFNRPNTSPLRRKSNNCNWDNFMKNKSRYAINTPYAYCNLTNNEQASEIRPSFVNYGGYYNDKPYGEKRTFNSLAVHQLKHHDVNEQRIKSFFREQRLRQEAENYFREMEKRKAYDKQN